MNSKTQTVQERIARLIDVAAGRIPADVVVRNIHLVNVFDGHIEDDVDIALSGSQIAGIGRYDGVTVVDGRGAYAAPSFIDGHMHIESTMVVPGEFAKVALACGTGAVIADPHEIANVAGTRGIRFMLEATRNSPLDFYFMLPSCVPATHLETNGETLDADRLLELRHNPRVLGLAEFMNYPGILFRDPTVLSKLAAFDGQLIDGHAPFLTGRDLEAYIGAGISTDHECTTAEEAREKLARGMWIMMREGSVTRDVKALIPLLTRENMHRIMLATDDRHPSDLLAEGHINYAVNLLLEAGIDLPTAVRLGSLNPATHYNLPRKGAIAPGYWADFIIFSDPRHVQPSSTYAKGELVAKDGVYLGTDDGHPPRSYGIKNSINIATPTYESLRVKAEPGKQLRVLQLIPHQVVTGERRVNCKSGRAWLRRVGHRTGRPEDGSLRAPSRHGARRRGVHQRLPHEAGRGGLISRARFPQHRRVRRGRSRHAAGSPAGCIHRRRPRGDEQWTGGRFFRPPIWRPHVRPVRT